jgi:carbon monoxide dehydrogenase subunit G
LPGGTEQRFRGQRPIDKTWAALTDVERTPRACQAQLQEVEGDEYRGIVKVKVGPITAQYKERRLRRA